MLDAALMADGVPADPKKIYPIDADRAFKKLNEIKPYIKVWWTSGGQQQQLIQDEEVDLIAMWNGRAIDSIKKGAPYEIVWNQALFGGYDEAWVLLKGAPNLQGGMKLLDFVGRAEPQACFARAMYYGPTNLKAYDYIDAELAKQLGTHPDNVKVSLELDTRYWSENMEVFTRRFEQWIQG